MPLCNFNSFLRNIDGAWKGLKHHSHKETKGIDGLSIADFISNEKVLLQDLKDRLKGGSFVFSKLNPVRIDGGKRTILVGTVADRIVGAALLKTILPKLKRYSTKSSYCPIVKVVKKEPRFIGVPHAVEDMQAAFGKGLHYVFETDITKFFDNINKQKLLDIIKKDITDPKILKLLEGVLAFEVWNCAPEDYSDEVGVAQGSALSPLFATIYLSAFDRKIERLTDVKLVRYVDDLVVLCRSQARAKEMHMLVDAEMKGMGLSIHPLGKMVKNRIKTNIKDVKHEPLDFLGLTFNFQQVTIMKTKMEDIIEDVRYILGAPKPTFLNKLNRIRGKMAGCIDQYRHPHYATKDQLNALIQRSQAAIDNHYYKAHNYILGFPPFTKASDKQKAGFKRFLGSDITDLLLK
jgi:RNA-directed DNA polymerase